MSPATGLVVSNHPRASLMMVVVAWPFEATLKHKPSWMELADWINLQVWLILMTNRHEPAEQAWYRLIDKAFEVTLTTLKRKRIINLDPVMTATDALYSVGLVYRQLCPLLHPVLTTAYPQLEQGYRIHFHHMDIAGVYLLLTLE